MASVTGWARRKTGQIAAGAGEGRVSISTMRKAAALVLAAGTLAGCARAQALDPAEKERLDDARTAAAEAMEAVDDLELRIEDLEDDLEEATDVTERVDKVSQRVGKVSERLWTSLAKLRASLDEVRAGAADAGATASSALARAEQAARDLAVLGNRYDYHLRRYHGGG